MGVQALVSEMDHDALEQLRQSIVTEMNARRPAIEMSDIHPRMSAAQKEAVSQEIARVLRGEDA